MANKVIMPKQGLQMTEGTITKWLVLEGGKVEEGQPLFEMETDKLNIEIDSSFAGILLKIIRNVGEIVPITETIAVIGELNDDISEFVKAVQIEDGKEEKTNNDTRIDESSSKNNEVEIARSGDRIFITPRAKKLAKAEAIEISEILGTGPRGLIVEQDVKEALIHADKAAKYTPVAKKMADEYGLDLSGIIGSGVNGRIQKSDIEKAMELRNCTPSSSVRVGKVIPFTGMRKVISDRMMQSLHGMAQANHRMKVDVSEIIKLREKLKADGVKVSINDVMVKIISKALLEFPIVNSSLTEEGILIKDYVNMGMAVAVGNGLIVPVIKDADHLSLGEINDASIKLIEKAKTGRLEPNDYFGGTFTITNLGMFDIDEFTAIVNPPESAILAIGKIDRVPVVEGESIVIKPIMVLSLTYDHRIIDGAPAAQFLQRVKVLINNPFLLL